MNVGLSSTIPSIRAVQGRIVKRGHINGDISPSFDNAFTKESDKTALPQGAALQGNAKRSGKTIDKTSELYAKSMELENYFVKQVLESMRKTVQKASLVEEGYSGKLAEDMLYEQYSASLTQGAGLGIADQIYLSLV